MRALCDKGWTVATAEAAPEHFGSAGRGPVRILAMRVMLEMLQESLDRA